LQNAYKYGSFSVLAGADYRVSDTFVLGGAISYSDTHSDYDQSLGNVKARTTGVAGYGTYYVDTWYVDGFIAYGSVDYDSTRNIFIPSNNPTAKAINTSATASPNGDQWSASIGVGRSFEMAPITVTPTARLGYIHVKNKAFTENEPNNGLGLSVDSRTIESLQSALGGKLSMVVNSSAGVFGPYVTAQWMHEFKNDNPSIVSKYIADPFNTFFAIPTATPTRDYAVFAIGTSVTLPNNLSGFAQFSGAAGLKDETNYGIVLGVRKQF
jgi:outer membrane lipase/esterase